MEDNIRMDIREIGWEFMDLMHLAQDRNKWWKRNFLYRKVVASFVQHLTEFHTKIMLQLMTPNMFIYIFRTTLSAD
jgi:hypothetical protein